MKMSSLFLLAALATTVACKSKYEKGFEAGNAQGYADGYDDGYVDGDKDGYEQGMADGEAYYGAATYDDGVSDGIKVGTPIGYAQGYSVGRAETYGPAYNQGKIDGYQPGYNAGKTAGYNLGYNDGDEDGYDDGFAAGRATIQGQINWAYNTGYNNGYDDGYDDGWYAGDAHGYNDGYDDGFDDGYDIGFDDGWDAALSVKPTGAMKGTSNVLSMVHNDLFNYSKIQAPKQTKRGLVAGNKLIFEETSLSNKDLERKAAAVEKYLVNSMASQVKGQFNLSSERSFQIAKVANHFRKQGTTRAVSEADSNAYAKEILGANFKEIEAAYKGVLKGEKAQLSQVLDQAAQKNGTSPEHMSSLMFKLFF